MQDQDLSKKLKIRDHTGERLLTEGDFPIVVSGSPAAAIQVLGLSEKDEAVYIELSEGRLHVRAAEMGVTVWHNRLKLKGLAELSNGDTLSVGSCDIELLAHDDEIIFRVSGADHTSQLAPPEVAPPVQPREIKPIPFRTGRQRPKPPPFLRWLVWAPLGLMLMLLAVSAWFVFTASQVVVRIDPAPERISMSGSIITPRLGGYYFLRPGEYTLRAFKQGYYPLEQSISVAAEKSQTVLLVMEKLPGMLTVEVYPEGQPAAFIEGAQIYIDGEEIGVTPLKAVEIKPGQRRLEIRAKKYRALQTFVEIEGGGTLQTATFSLAPAWGTLTIGSVPAGANVRVDGDLFGKTPLLLELMEGTRRLELSADRYKTWQAQVEVEANRHQILGEIRLQPADGKLALRSNPSGASVTVGDTYMGRTPLQIPLHPDVEHIVRLSKPGYERIARKVKVPSAELRKLTINLTPRVGIILLVVEPEDAELLIDGEPKGAAPEKLRLISVEHQLEFRKEGYKPFRTRLTPRPGFTQELRVALDRQLVQKIDLPLVIQAANEYTLKLIRPKHFTMGSSRREQGRRSNETLRKVVLKRPFYMGTREVTNREFREFLEGHNSGAMKGKSLNRDDQPVVQVTWEQAALFCNWLSAKESLPPVYIKRGDKLVAAEPMGTGYRLPTEAEWEYSARFTSSKATMKYPWGDNFPPPPQSVNVADLAARGIVAYYLENYDDGYPVTAPPGSFRPNELGLHDLGGNVAEWCHDNYSIYSYSARMVYFDPSGPLQGKHRVVKGSSWKHASISALRGSYRDYSNGKRSDLGFRLCRYLDELPQKK